MKINNGFTVSAPIQQAWETMLNLERIAPCLPGAAIQEEKGDGEYDGTMKVKIGPITANYKGTVKFEEVDEENHRAVLQATGRAAQFGRGIAQDVATKMLGQFASCLEEEITGSPDEGAAKEPTGEDNGSRDGSQQGETPPGAAVAGTEGRIISSEDPSVMAGGTVEGAVVAGGSEGAPTTEQVTTQQAPRREEPEAFDIGAASQEAILKRITPVLAGAGVLVALIWLFRRRR